MGQSQEPEKEAEPFFVNAARSNKMFDAAVAVNPALKPYLTLKSIERLYLRTKNPAYAWLGIKVWLGQGSHLKIPGWISSYLLRSSKRVMTAGRQWGSFEFPTQKGWNLQRSLNADFRAMTAVFDYLNLRAAGRTDEDAAIQATGRELRAARKLLSKGRFLLEMNEKPSKPVRRLTGIDREQAIEQGFRSLLPNAKRITVCGVDEAGDLTVAVWEKDEGGRLRLAEERQMGNWRDSLPTLPAKSRK